MTGTLDLVVHVGGSDVDDGEAADLARALRAELLTLDVENVEPLAGGAPPPGVKAGEAITIGALLLSLAPAVIGQAIDAALSWLRRQPADIEVDIGGHKLRANVTRAQRDAIVAAFLDQARPGVIDGRAGAPGVR
jgi:hypothetical protein